MAVTSIGKKIRKMENWAQPLGPIKAIRYDPTRRNVDFRQRSHDATAFFDQHVTAFNLLGTWDRRKGYPHNTEEPCLKDGVVLMTELRLFLCGGHEDKRRDHQELHHHFCIHRDCRNIT